MFCVLVFFFFKQKTAYEMRISDWSSDVCSSDLPVCRFSVPKVGFQLRVPSAVPPDPAVSNSSAGIGFVPSVRSNSAWMTCWRSTALICPVSLSASRVSIWARLRLAIGVSYCSSRMSPVHPALGFRSEEHTSELQPLMRRSYAVFFSTTKQHIATDFRGTFYN